MEINSNINPLINRDDSKARMIAQGIKHSRNDKRLMDACYDFESIFIKLMLNSMKKNIPKAKLIDGGFAEDIFDDMLYTEYSKIMARNGNFGLAKMIFNQLKGGL